MFYDLGLMALTIMLSKEGVSDEAYGKWADSWLSGKDRSDDSALSAWITAHGASMRTGMKEMNKFGERWLCREGDEKTASLHNEAMMFRAICGIDCAAATTALAAAGKGPAWWAWQAFIEAQLRLADERVRASQ